MNSTKQINELMYKFKNAKLCFYCLDHFDYAIKGYYIRISQGFPNKTILKASFCSDNCYELGMLSSKFHLVIKQIKIRLRLNTWLEHPIICNCEICIIENL